MRGTDLEFTEEYALGGMDEKNDDVQNATLLTLKQVERGLMAGQICRNRGGIPVPYCNWNSQEIWK